MMNFEEFSQMVEANPELLDKLSIHDYETDKERLMIMVCDYASNAETLATAPYMEHDGLAITYYLLTDIGDDSRAYCMINDAIFARYGVSLERLHEDALANMAARFPATFDPIESMVMGMTLDGEMSRTLLSGQVEAGAFVDTGEDCLIWGSQMGLRVLSNTIGHWGAAALFYPGVLDSIAQIYGKSFYVIPSSIHECLIVDPGVEASLEFLQETLRTVNENEVAEDEILSDAIYFYDLSAGRLCLATEDLAPSDSCAVG